MRLRLALALLLASTLAHARSEGRILGYPRDHVWSPAVRFLVVDERAKVIEKDADTGYVLFEVTHDRKTYRGSLEIITVQGSDGRPNIRFAINLVGGALHKEAGMLKRLEQKLRSELGSPPPPPKKQEDKDAPRDPKDAPKDTKDVNKDGKLPEVQP